MTLGEDYVGPLNPPKGEFSKDGMNAVATFTWDNCWGSSATVMVGSFV